MKASQLLCAKSSEEGVIVVEGLYNNKIRIIGSSIAKFISSDEYRNSVALSIKRSDKGFIAVYVVLPSGKHVEHFEFFLDIGWIEDSGTPYIGLDSQWVPRHPERLGVINFFGIRTDIDGVIFSSSEYDKKPGVRYVNDHNLLCKYLAGDIEADVVKQAAAECIDEENARVKLPELEKKIQELTKLVAEKEKLLAKTEELLSAEKQRAVKCYQQEMLVYERLSAASKVIGEMEKQWFHRPSIKKALQAYKAAVSW